MNILQQIHLGLSNNRPEFWPRLFINFLKKSFEKQNWTDFTKNPESWFNQHYRFPNSEIKNLSDFSKKEGGILQNHREENAFFSLSLATHTKIRVAIQDCFPDSLKTCINLADLVAARTFKMLGVGPYHFNHEIDWSSDLKGNSWLKGPSRELNDKLFSDLTNNEHLIGDVKIPWELNKHLFFFELARAFVLTGDDRYPREFCAQLESWWEQNTVGMNLAWNAPLIVAQRAIAWVFCMRFFIHSPAITQNFYLKFLASLYTHLVWIQSHYEIHPRSSNHLIGNLAGVLAITNAYPDFDISRESERKAKKILNAQLRTQIHQDGVDYEKSTSYHRYVLEFLYSIILAFTYSGRKIPYRILKTSEIMTEYLMNVIAPNGMANLISDADGAYVYKFGNCPINDYRPHLALGAALFNRGDFAQISQGQEEVIIWALGPEKRLSTKRAPQYQSRFFPEGGIVIQRDGWEKNSVQLTFDCGDIGMGYQGDYPYVTHGHDDTLSFTLSAFGEQILVDNGSGSFTGNVNIHDTLRLSMGHDTLSLSPPEPNFEDASRANVESHSIPLGPWTLKKRATVLGKQFCNGDGLEFCSASHNGYRRFVNSPVHKRFIFFFLPDVFIIIDRVFETRNAHSRPYHKILLPFHLFPGTRLTLNQDTMVTKLNNAILNCAITEQRNPWQHKIYEGQHSPYKGWYAQDYNQCVPAPTVDFETVSPLPFYNAFALHCGNKNIHIFNGIKFVFDKEQGSLPLGLSIEGQEISFLIHFLPQGRGLLPKNLSYPPDAEFITLRYCSNRLQKAWGITKKEVISLTP